jgi:site-specific DNA-methyltransferase (adenine-specific)
MTMGKGKNKRFSKGKNWDNETPTQEYFTELFRVSKNQIIWGGNYFILPCVRGWIFWDKNINGSSSFSDGELAWTSFDRVLRKAEITYNGFLGADTNRVHPTQKPVALYKWLLDKYAKEGDKILDTHLGSGSIAIACYEYGFNLTGFELDSEYYNAAKSRIENHIQSHPKLF